jgi:hypothetical protein
MGQITAFTAMKTHAYLCKFNPILVRTMPSTSMEGNMKNSVAYNCARRKRAFQYTAFILWGGGNYRKQHYSCVEDGVRALFPPFDAKIMGYKMK